MLAGSRAVERTQHLRRIAVERLPGDTAAACALRDVAVGSEKDGLRVGNAEVGR